MTRRSLFALLLAPLLVNRVPREAGDHTLVFEYIFEPPPKGFPVAFSRGGLREAVSVGFRVNPEMLETLDPVAIAGDRMLRGL